MNAWLLVGALLSVISTECQVLLQVHDAGSGAPVERAIVVGMGARDTTNAVGEANLPAQTGHQRIRVTRLGFVPADTVVEVSAGDTIRVALEPRPFSIDPLTVSEQMREGGGARERALFHREPVPGLVGLSRFEGRELPVLGEVDVLRSIQALPGVTPSNDLSARLHVRGGAPDQNVFLLDGARIFAPYHMFGIFGAFNTDALARTEVYRGAMPARHGGALSSVVELEQRAGSADSLDVGGGLGMLGARVMMSGPLPGLAGNWMVAGRRTHADLVLDKYTERGFPYAFADLHGQAAFRLAEDHRVRISAFGSGDRFRMFLDDADEDVVSEWNNGAASVQWDWDVSGGGVHTVFWGSRYEGLLGVGGTFERRASRNDVRVGGARVSFSRQGEQSGFRIGLDGEFGDVDLVGANEAGGLFTGRSLEGHRSLAGFMEWERWFGDLRVAPGLRAELTPGATGVLIGPRLFLRYHFAEDLALTAGLTRTHQRLSTLRDDRFPLPGPPFWFAHRDEMPTSRADAAIVALEGWLGRDWSFEASIFRRRFTDVARWRPADQGRTLDALAFDDGSANGFSVSMRRHGDRLTGWLGYDYQRIRMTESDAGLVYAPPWEKRHALQAAGSVRAWRGLRISAQLNVASGTPFWPQSGRAPMYRLDPIHGGLVTNGFYPIWSEQQMRLPEYVRLDLSGRWPFGWGAAMLEPYVSLLNVTGRQNVLYYRLTHKRVGANPENVYLDPRLQLPIPMAFPSIGIDIRF